MMGDIRIPRKVKGISDMQKKMEMSLPTVNT